MIKENDGVYRFTTRSPMAYGIMVLAFLFGPLTIGAGAYDEPIMWGLVAIGIGGIALGVLMIIVLIKFPKPVVVVSDEGITEYASKVSKGVIRWEEIYDVYVYETFTTNSLMERDQKGGKKDSFVGITLMDPDEYAERLNSAQKGLIKLSLKLGQAPINIPCNLLGKDAEELVELCQRYISKSKESIASIASIAKPSEKPS